MVPRITFVLGVGVGVEVYLYHKHSLSRRRSARSGVASALAVPRKVSCSLNNYWTSHFTHLGGPGELSGATRRPRGRPWRPPECPDGHGRLRRRSPAGEGG